MPVKRALCQSNRSYVPVKDVLNSVPRGISVLVKKVLCQYDASAYRRLENK